MPLKIICEMHKKWTVVAMSATGYAYALNRPILIFIYLYWVKLSDRL
ncbi:hypothetical protein [Nostoc sp.]